LEDVGAVEAPSIISFRYFIFLATLVALALVDLLAFLAVAFLAAFGAAFAFALGAAFLAADFDFFAGIAMGTPLR
jgi:hypothetical protein